MFWHCRSAWTEQWDSSTSRIDRGYRHLIEISMDKTKQNLKGGVGETAE